MLHKYCYNDYGMWIPAGFWVKYTDWTYRCYCSFAESLWLLFYRDRNQSLRFRTLKEIIASYTWKTCSSVGFTQPPRIALKRIILKTMETLSLLLWKHILFLINYGNKFLLSFVNFPKQLFMAVFIFLTIKYY